MSILIHFKCLRSNFFIIISHMSGHILFTKSSGNLGFKNTQKRTKDAFIQLLEVAFQYVLQLKIKVTHIFLKLEGSIKNVLFKYIRIKLLKVLKTHNIQLVGFRLINKISHNGCRKSIHRK